MGFERVEIGPVAFLGVKVAFRAAHEGHPLVSVDFNQMRQQLAHAVVAVHRDSGHAFHELPHADHGQVAVALVKELDLCRP